MRLLLLTKKFPWPLKDGEVIAIHNNIKGFTDLGHDVTVLAINTLKHYTDPESLPEKEKARAKYISVTVDTNVKLGAALVNLAGKKSYHVERFESKDYARALADLLSKEHFDLIQCEGLYFGPYLDMIRKYSKAPITMRAHNVESEIWQRVKAETKNPVKKQYLNVQISRLARYEKEQLKQYDAIVPISARDADALKDMGAEVPVYVHQAGIDLQRYEPYHRREAGHKKVGFIGSLDWLPNLEGVQWFVKEVWPKVLLQEPEAQFCIAGRNMPASMESLSSDMINVAGEVPDALEFMAARQVLVVPLFSGSGMRIKIIEALALGKCVLSTSIGAEGLNYTDGENILIANDAETFAVQLIEILRQPETVQQIGEHAYQFIKSNFDNRALAGRLIEFYQKQFKL